MVSASRRRQHGTSSANWVDKELADLGMVPCHGSFNPSELDEIRRPKLMAHSLAFMENVKIC